MDKGQLTARQNGQIGGEMIKRLVKAGQQVIANGQKILQIPIAKKRNLELS